MELIRNEVSKSEVQKKVQLLTLAPQNCSREVISRFFGVSTYMVERSRKVFEKNGILGEVDSKNGENIKIHKIYINYTNISNSEKFITRGNQMC